MNKYQIEKAGAEYSGLTEDSKDPNSRIKGMLSIAFKDGVYWYINSIWHDAKTDIPEAHFPVLVEDYLGDSEVSMLAPKEGCPKSWVRWAYIGDLLPK